MNNEKKTEASSLEQRKLDEIEFHNRIRLVTDDPHVADTRWSPEMERTVSENPLWANMKYYSIERRSREYIKNWFSTHCQNARVLDLCCGNGADSIFLAKVCNAEVVGCDLSDVSISNCRALAEREGVAAKTCFDMQDAERMNYPDNSFDVVTEYGALHHVDLPKVYAEIARVLRPGGRAICNETLGHNLAIHWYRKLTPQLRTPWEVEHILKKPQIDLARKYFRKVAVHHYHLATLIAVPFRNTLIFQPLLTILEWLDSIILKIPLLRWQSWQAVIELENPMKEINP
ncbi:MAG: class I SAM-dependent methyltransferase [Syntrophaceae bacterium]